MIYKKDLLKRIELLEKNIIPAESNYNEARIELNKRIDDFNRFYKDLLDFLDINVNKEKVVEETWVGDKIVTKYKFSNKSKTKKK